MSRAVVVVLCVFKTKKDSKTSTKNKKSGKNEHDKQWKHSFFYVFLAKSASTLTE